MWSWKSNLAPSLFSSYINNNLKNLFVCLEIYFITTGFVCLLLVTCVLQICTKNSSCNPCHIYSSVWSYSTKARKGQVWPIYQVSENIKRFSFGCTGQEVITLYLKQLWRTKWGHEMLGNRLIRPLDGKATSCSKSFVEKTTSCIQHLVSYKQRRIKCFTCTISIILDS